MRDHLRLITRILSGETSISLDADVHAALTPTDLGPPLRYTEDLEAAMRLPMRRSTEEGRCVFLNWRHTGTRFVYEATIGGRFVALASSYARAVAVAALRQDEAEG